MGAIFGGGVSMSKRWMDRPVMVVPLNNVPGGIWMMDDKSGEKVLVAELSRYSGPRGGWELSSKLWALATQRRATHSAAVSLACRVASETYFSPRD